MAALIDTDVFSFVFKGDTRAALYEPHLQDQFLFLSFMSFAELRNWILNRTWGARRIARFEKMLRKYSIQYSTYEICVIWSEILHEAKLSGKPIEDADAWVAATAVALGVPLISHNSKHFKNISRLDLITENK